jgi:hypothetical protein
MIQIPPTDTPRKRTEIHPAQSKSSKLHATLQILPEDHPKITRNHPKMPTCKPRYEPEMPAYKLYAADHLAWSMSCSVSLSSPRLQSGPDGSARHGFMCPKKYLKRSLIFGVGDQHPPSLRSLRRVRGVESRQVQDPLTFPGIQAAKKHDIPYAMFVVARRIMAAWIESTLPRSTEMPYIPSDLKHLLGPVHPIWPQREDPR